MAFGLPKIDMPALRAELQAKWDQLIAKLDEILVAVKDQHKTS